MTESSFMPDADPLPPLPEMSGVVWPCVHGHGMCPLVHDLGAAVDYNLALAWQQAINDHVSAGGQERLLLLEHEPVLTLTARPGVREHVLADAAQLAALGVAVCATNRGGDVTYHGPGQLVAYPIIRIRQRGLGLSEWMRLLEDVVIGVLAKLGVQGRRDPGATGVWVDPLARALGQEAVSPAAAWHKVCAMGVRVRRGTTMHGLALNLAPNRAHFALIVPCGLHGRAVGALADWPEALASLDQHAASCATGAVDQTGQRMLALKKLLAAELDRRLADHLW